MANTNTTPQADPKTLKELQTFWVSFMHLTKYSIIAIVVLLALMAFFLV